MEKGLGRLRVNGGWGLVGDLGIAGSGQFGVQVALRVGMDSKPSQGQEKNTCLTSFGVCFQAKKYFLKTLNPKP